MKVYILRKTLDWFEVQVPPDTTLDKAIDTAKDMLEAGDERIFPLNHREHIVRDFYMNEADVKVQLLVEAEIDLNGIDERIIDTVNDLMYSDTFIKYNPYGVVCPSPDEIPNDLEEDTENDKKLQALSESVYDAVYSTLVNENVPASIREQYRKELDLI